MVCLEAGDGASALQGIDALKPDVAFMDIQMPEMTGLDVVKRLTHLPEIVFTTAFDQYAVTAFELNAVDYLLKPFSRERFDTAVARLFETESQSAREDVQQALAQSSTRDQAPLTRILVRDRGRIFPLSIDEIEYLKSDSKYTVIAARKTTFLVRIAISELEGRLNAAKFVRVHRSAIVNLEFVDSMKADEQSQLQIHMRDGTQLAASRDASKMLRDMSI